MARRRAVRVAVACGSACMALAATGCTTDHEVAVGRADALPAATTPPPTPTEPAPPTTAVEPTPPTTSGEPTPTTSTGPGGIVGGTELLGPPIAIGDVADVGDAKQPRPYDAVVAATLRDLDEWWSTTYPALYGEPWEPLAGGVYPSYPGRDDVPGCGEARTDHRDVAEYAALYCADGDFLVYDDGPGSLLGSLADEFGPAIMGVVLAHEYGHAVQFRAGDLERALPTVITEQQADCLAGAWVGRAAGGDSPVIRLSDADVRGGLVAMVTVRDPVGIDQFTDGGHGSAFDRVGAFQEGVLGGAERCATLLDEPLPLMPNSFTTTADQLNEGDLAYGYTGDAIAPLIVETLNAYWAFALGGGFEPLRLQPVRSPGEAPCDPTPTQAVPGVVVCAPARVVAIDERTALTVYDDPIDGRSDFGVAYLIATGWADVAQDALGSDLTGEARALANDCLVGAWALDLFPRELRSADDGNAGTISPGDLDEAVIAAITIGDPGTGDDVIGSAFEKIDSFRTGVLGGLAACTPRFG